jgi:hypothetical protein
MESLAQQVVNCPYCGESIEVLVDREEAGSSILRTVRFVASLSFSMYL